MAKSKDDRGRVNSARFVITPAMRQGFSSRSPIPTRLVSNEEYNPLPQTPAQREVEQRIDLISDNMSRKLGRPRRDFLRTTGGMAASLLALNQVFGRFFDVLDIELFEPMAFAKGRGPDYLVIDLQTHYVGSAYDPTNAEARRKGGVAKDMLVGLREKTRKSGANPALADNPADLRDLHWANFVKEIFLDSETAIGLISTPPGPYPQEAVVPPKQMTHIRDEINRVTRSRRMLAHGLVTPQLGKADLDFMQMQAETMKVDAWKGYTGAAPKGFDRGWWMDDEKVAYPMLEKARALKVPIVCVHKGLPLGPVEDYNHPRDIIKAAKDFPDLTFLVYHSGFKTVDGIDKVFARTGEIPWTTEFCKQRRANPKLTNIYMELGGTFGQLVSMQPEVCAHLLGQVIDAFGADHVLWGTDSIWYGSPQWQIEAFRRFQIPDRLIEKFRYRPLTSDVKAQIFGRNAARLFRLDLGAKRNQVPADYVTRMRMAYLDQGAVPSHRFYGWVTD
jgi:predicted TIM-barrel fold metal-dependent hydrolase